MKKIFILAIILYASAATYAQAWIEVGTGTDALNANYSIYSIITDRAGNVYAAGGFTDSASSIGGHTYVTRWNGSEWLPLGSGANALNANSSIYSLTQDAAGNIYAAGNFTDVNRRQYVAKWNGTQWTALGIDTIGLNATAPIYAITTDAAGHVYAAGDFNDFVFAYNHRYVAMWNDSIWTEVGLDSIRGLNADSTIYALATDPHGHLYAAGAFTDTLGYAYVARWDGTSWSAVGTGANALHVHGTINAMITDSAGHIYVGGTFTDTLGYYYIAKWDGNKWTELSNPATNQIGILGQINALTLDSAGNVYAGGNIPDSTGNYYYVVVWNGSRLIVADSRGTGPLNANDAVLTMATDRSGNIYAAGNFKDANYYQYVAEFTSNIPSGTGAIADEQLHIYPNPTPGRLYIQADHLSGSATIQIMDAVGRSLYSRTTDDTTIHGTLDLSAYAPGMYTLLMSDGSGRKLLRKIIKN